ncbi:MAG: hypothetical protein ACK58T_41000, partial [Phycisphaerae bacterium]
MSDSVERLRKADEEDRDRLGEFWICDKAADEIVRLREYLKEIARQRLHAEITDSDPDEIDWLGGYEACVHT